jgi:alpha-glucosidase (family GH31 glycosyl hydrolase)
VAWLHSGFRPGAPYITKLANEVPKTGLPIFRPIWFNFPSDKNAETITDEFMVGDALLVAPVLAKGMTNRDICLPEGRWRNYKTGAIIEGGRMISAYSAPLDTLPLFVNLQASSQLEAAQ